MVPKHPLHTKEDIQDIIHNISVAARVALAGVPIDEADLRDAAPIDGQTFDLNVDVDVLQYCETAKHGVQKASKDNMVVPETGPQPIGLSDGIDGHARTDPTSRTWEMAR